MVDSVVSFLREPIVPHNPGSNVRLTKVAYAICNSLGSIILVNESRRVVRKTNVINQNDLRITTPIDYLRGLSWQPSVTITLGAEASVLLLYCHRVSEKLRSHCRKLVLLGPVAIVFGDHRSCTEEAQLEHGRRCGCGHLCHSRPPTFSLSDGDRLSIDQGVFYVSASAEQHCIYMTKKEFKDKITFSSDNGSNSVNAIMEFVNSLPDTPEPMDI